MGLRGWWLVATSRPLGEAAACTADGRCVSRTSFGIHVHQFRAVELAKNTHGSGTSLSVSLQVSILADADVLKKRCARAHL